MTQPKVAPKPWRRRLRTANPEKAPRAYRFLAHVVHGLMNGLVRRTWRGQEHTPTGGSLVVCNHLSNFDVPSVGEYLIWSGRWPRFLGKSDIWKVPVVGYFARECQQIPVLRNTDRAQEALAPAREALRAGKCVAIFPEGTITADPDRWPMVGRLGAARLALSTGVPVVPMAVWGTDALLGRKRLKLHYLFSLRRRPVSIIAGPPVDLSAFPVSDDPTREDLDGATKAIIGAILELCEQLRGEQAPAERWDMRAGQRVPY